MSKTNCSLIEASRKAALCGMTYGKWVEAGCPEPPKNSTITKTGCKSINHIYPRRKGKAGSPV